MPISDHVGVDTTGYAPIAPPPASTQQLEQPLLPVRDSKLRFSAPNIPGSFPSSDTLIGYHLGGMIPQWRIPTAPSQSGSSTSTSTGGTVVISGGGSSTTTTSPKAQIASSQTSVLFPGQQFTGSITMAKAFVVLGVTASAVARIRLYSAQNAQTTDLSRPITQGPGFGTEQGIIGDIVLDTLPAVWQAVNMTGYNGNSPQTTAVYLTCDNIGASSGAITISVTYVPIES